MHQPSGEVAREPRLSVAVIGDSLASGLGSTGTEGGLTQRVFNALRAARPGSTFANLSVPHATMGDVLHHQISQLRGTRPDVVILIAGANDLRYTRDRMVFARRFRVLLQEVHRAAPRARIFAAGMPDVTQTAGVPRFAKAAVSRICRAFDRTMRSIVEEFGDAFIDLYAYTSAPLEPGAEYLCGDGYHPNDFGYAEIARRALPAILEDLRLLDRAPRAFRDDDCAETRFPA